MDDGNTGGRSVILHCAQLKSCNWTLNNEMVIEYFVSGHTAATWRDTGIGIYGQTVTAPAQT